MHWLYLLVSLGCFALSMNKGLPSWAVLGLLGLALLGMVAWALGWMASRLAGVSRDEVRMVHPDELRRLREIAEARRSAPRDGEAG